MILGGAVRLAAPLPPLVRPPSQALEYGCSLDPVCQLAKVLEPHPTPGQDPLNPVIFQQHLMPAASVSASGAAMEDDKDEEDGVIDLSTDLDANAMEDDSDHQQSPNPLPLASAWALTRL